MARYSVALFLAMVQLLTPVMGREQAVLCLHPDGSALVESGAELAKCHVSPTQAEEDSISAPQCRDIAIPVQAADQQTVRHRGSASSQFQLFAVSFVAPGIIAAYSHCFAGSALAITTIPAGNPLESLSTIILTI